MTVTVNEGTQTGIRTTTVSGAEVQHVRPEGGTFNAGTVVVTVGTMAKMPSDGTISVNGDPSGQGVYVQPATGANFSTYGRHTDEFATVISSGTSTLGTIKPAVSGSAIYVTDIVVSAGTTTNLEIASGGTSTPILGTMHFSTNGGAVMNFRTPIRTASGSALVYKQSVNGPLTITALGYVD